MSTEKIEKEINDYRDLIKNEIHKVVLKNMNTYGKNIKLLVVPNNYLKIALDVAREELFQTDILFMMEVSRYLKSTIYIKFYNPKTFPEKIQSTFERKIKRQILKGKNTAIIARRIDMKNKISVECHIRNYEKIIGTDRQSFHFDTETYGAGDFARDKYCVVTKIH